MAPFQDYDIQGRVIAMEKWEKVHETSDIWSDIPPINDINFLLCLKVFICRGINIGWLSIFCWSFHMHFLETDPLHSPFVGVFTFFRPYLTTFVDFWNPNQWLWLYWKAVTCISQRLILFIHLTILSSSFKSPTCPSQQWKYKNPLYWRIRPGASLLSFTTSTGWSLILWPYFLESFVGVSIWISQRLYWNIIYFCHIS